MNTSGRDSESYEQQKVVTWFWGDLHKRLPGALLIAIPNGGFRSITTAARLKKEGVVAGFPDMFLFWPAGDFHGLAVEMKKKHGGRLDKKQKVILAALEAAGYKTVVAHGYEEAKAAILEYSGITEE